MFAQKNRLGRAEFTQTYKQGRKIHLPGFLLVYAPAPVLKAAAVVGKKVSKSAVARNFLRRRIYEAVREAGASEASIIIVAKPTARAYSYQKLSQEISAALVRLLGSKAVSR